MWNRVRESCGWLWAGPSSALRVERRGLGPALFIPFVEPLVREAAVADEAGIFRPADQVIVGLVDLPEHHRVTPEIGVVDLDLAPVGVPDDLPEFGGIEVRLLQIQVDQGRRPNVRRVQDPRLYGVRRHAVPGGLVEDVERGEIPFLRPFLLRPPGLPQEIRHPAEILAGTLPRRPRVEEAADLLVAAGKDVHDDQEVGEIEGSVSCVERLEKADAHVEPLPELLPAVDGTVAAAADILRRPAGEAPVRFLAVHGDGECIHGCVHCTIRDGQAPCHCEEAIVLLSLPPKQSHNHSLNHEIAAALRASQ